VSFTFRFIPSTAPLESRPLALNQFKISGFCLTTTKSFLGTSMNAVKTQLWIALCAYLVLSFLKFQSKLGTSLQRMLRILQLNLFERRDLMSLFRPPDTKNDCEFEQLSLI